MDANAIVGTTHQQAATHALEIQVPKVDLELKFASYWDEVKDVLPDYIVKAATKGGFRTVSRKRAVKAAGGAGEFFKPVLAEVVELYLTKEPRQALLIDQVELVTGIEKDIIRAVVQLEPEVRWSKVPGVDAPLVVKVPKEPVGYVDRLVVEAIRRGQDESAVLVPLDDQAQLALGQIAVIDCVSVLDGQPWAPGTLQNNKWPMDRSKFFIPEILDKMLGMVKGESKDMAFTMPDTFGEHAGKMVAINIRVNQILFKDVPKIDDDLALNYGYKTLDAWKLALTTEINARVSAQRNELLDVNTTAELVNKDVVDVDPVPFNWMVQKARQIYDGMRSKVKSEEAVVVKFANAKDHNDKPIVDKQGVLEFLAYQCAQSLVQDLVLRSWGRKAGVEGDSTLQNIDMYVDATKKKLGAVRQVEEFEVTQPG